MNFNNLLGSEAHVIAVGDSNAGIGKTNVAISGLTITGGRYGVNVWGSTNLTLSDNTVSNNLVGIDFKGNANDPSYPNIPVLVTRNNVINNGNWGVGITRTRQGAVTHNYIAGNGTASDCDQEGIDCTGIFLNRVFDSVISGNVITGNGDGIEAYDESTPAISNNVITNNKLAGIALMFVETGGKITGNTILNNGGTMLTDIVVADGNTGTIINPNISFNVFDDIGGGTKYPASSGTRGVGSYNINSSGNPIAVP